MLARADVERRLAWWVHHVARPRSELGGVFAMPGNSGLSYGFDVLDARGGIRDRFVIRMAPPGVRREGSTDVLRQVPLLAALFEARIAVVPVAWSTGDPAWFGTDVIIQRRLSAESLHMTDRVGPHPLRGNTNRYLVQAVKALTGIHRLEWRSVLGNWSETRSIDEELAFGHRLLGKSPEREWALRGERLLEDLRASDPGAHRVGLSHGDFQTNNILYDNSSGEIRAIVDWELAGIGAVGLDIGWLSIMTDRSCWDQRRARAMRVVVEPATLLAWYEDAMGDSVRAFDWYRALACFRFGAIAGFNVRLHRRGYRVDAANAALATSVPVLFERGLQLLTD